MANTRHAAEACQLGRKAAGGLSLGLRLQRAGRQGRLHTAESTARRPDARRTRARDRAVTLSAAVVALLAGGVVWVLLATRLTARPWETPGSPEDVPTGLAPGVPPAKIWLAFLLGVITTFVWLILSASL